MTITCPAGHSDQFAQVGPMYSTLIHRPMVIDGRGRPVPPSFDPNIRHAQYRCLTCGVEFVWQDGPKGRDA